MMRRAILFLAILTLPYAIKAQTIRGEIVDEDENPIGFVTVILQKQDSTFVKSAIADSSGMFAFDSDLKNYRLIFQHLQYNTLEIESFERELGVIRMTQKENMQISEIVVKGERPLVKVNEGILSYDIQQITQNRVVSSAYEAVLQIPGVSERDGLLNLAGAAGVMVILNGRPTSMSGSQLIEILKQMPASYVETAEVMYSAPPQYHVRGAAINLVINSIEEEEISRFQGELRGGYTQHHYANYSTGASLLYSSDKIAADFMYTYSDLKTRTGLDLTSHHNVQGTLYEVAQKNRGMSERRQHTARLGLDYKLKKDNLLSLVYNMSISTKGKSVENSFGTHSNSQNTKKFDDQFHNIALDYTSDFGFKAGIDYTFYKSPSTQYFLDSDHSEPETEFISKSQQKINSFLVYADQTHNLRKDWIFNYGAKFSYANDHDYQLYDIQQGGGELHDTDKTIKEYIYNMYVGLGKNLSEQLSMNVSLAGERYELAEDHDWALLPQANMTYMRSASNIYQISFSSDKQYPSYWEKQNYRGYLNGYAVIHGNPRLKAFNSYSTQFAYIRNQKYIFALYYVYQPKYSVQLGYQSSDELTLIYQTQNWKFNRIIGLNVEIPFRVGKWLSSRLSFNGFYQQSKHDDFFDMRFNNEKFIGYVNANNTINISSKPNIKLNITAYYMTEPIQGIMNLSYILGVDAAVKWSFADSKAELDFKATDIFNGSYPDVYVRSGRQNFTMNMISDARSFLISFSYKFGGFKVKERKDIDKSRYGH